MHTNRTIWALSLCLCLPVLWLVVTTPVDGVRAAALILGALMSAGVLVVWAWRAHRAGLLLPNRCGTCQRPMCYTRPGEVRPPNGSSGTKQRFWRCRHCGRLV